MLSQKNGWFAKNKPKEAELMLAHSGGWSPDVSLLRSRHKKWNDMKMNEQRSCYFWNIKWFFVLEQRAAINPIYLGRGWRRSVAKSEVFIFANFKWIQISYFNINLPSTFKFHHHMSNGFKNDYDMINMRDEKNKRWETQTCII